MYLTPPPYKRILISHSRYFLIREINDILGNNGSKEEALDYLQRAIKIDQNDVTLYFKFAYFAALSKKFHMARSALEESLYNQQQNGEQPMMATNNEGNSFIGPRDKLGSYHGG